MSKNQIIIIALIISVSLFPVQFAISESINGDTDFIYIQSRFMLWDTAEKMIDGNFTITLISLNESNINTYKIIINDEIYNGSYNQYFMQQINTNDSVISIHIEINGIPKLTISNIRVTNNITSGGISTIGEPFKISLSPFEWRKQEWNIFFSVIVSAIISVIVSYIIVIRYRKLHGVMEIK